MAEEIRPGGVETSRPETARSRATAARRRQLRRRPDQRRTAAAAPDQIASDRFAERMERRTKTASRGRSGQEGRHHRSADRPALRHRPAPRLRRAHRPGRAAPAAPQRLARRARTLRRHRARQLRRGRGSLRARSKLFVGPPGAGKTTTIAKIAAQERARRGQRLGLLAADGFRVGAVEQLRLYADIIGSAVRRRAHAGGARAFDARRTRGTVLVDTAGRSVRDAARAGSRLDAVGPPGVRTHLVLPAGTPRPRRCATCSTPTATRGPTRVVLTQARRSRLAVAAGAACCTSASLPVSYLGTGQRVPEDLERATPARLAAHVLGHGVHKARPRGSPHERR